MPKTNQPRHFPLLPTPTLIIPIFENQIVTFLWIHQDTPSASKPLNISIAVFYHLS